MRITLLSIFLVTSFLITAQQIPDLDYNPPIPNPTYDSGLGPVVFIDEGHYNFHTKDGRYSTFARLLERDGYQVKAFNGLFTLTELQKGKILVISNALHKDNVRNWFKPVHSAFTEIEIRAIKEWVEQGGCLFLIADHMPLAGAAIKLGKAFGFEMTDGFVMPKNGQRGLPDIFNKSNGSLGSSIITNGNSADQTVDKIASFTGQAFQIPEGATSILNLDDSFHNLLPDTAWVFGERTTVKEVDNWSQGAFMNFGDGKLVVFGEAAMFSGQLAGPNKVKMGMNNEAAPENYKLLLNIIRWLDGVLAE